MSHSRSLGALSLVALTALTSCPPAMAASPRLNTILPRGVQRGTEQVLTFTGARLADAQEIFFYDRGFELLKLEADGANRLRATIRVAPDCRIGEHVAQVRTASGISDFRTFYVGALPEVAEKEPNNDFATPQAIPMNVTVLGVVQSEDVDYFAVEAKKGQRLSVEVEGMRLGTAFFDPYVAILDGERFEQAVADDTPLVQQDAVAALVVPKDGTYIVQVRESAYGGNGNCHYRLHVGTFPRPVALYPAGGKRGETVDVRFIGDPLGDWSAAQKLPEQADADFRLLAEDAGGSAPSPQPFRVGEQGNVLENEPNNTRAQATPAAVAEAFNGIIDAPGDIDFFAFDAKKGQVFEVECYARRIRSALDPVLHIFDAKGKAIVGNDDARGPDSYVRWTVPADGRYTMRVMDHLQRGGGTFVYRVEMLPVQPSLTIGIPRIERYSQVRQTICVPRGGRFGTIISASRTNFGGPIALDGAGLPPGITIDADPMPANLNTMPVVVTAAADAPIGGALVDFRAHVVDASKEIRGGFRNRADLIIAQPNQSLYRWCDVRRLAVAVVEELPFQIVIDPPQVPLVRNGSMQLRIIAKRQEGFTAPIQILLPFRPPGVGATTSVTIPKEKNEITYPIGANGGAQVKKWKIFALGSADVGGPAWVASPLTELEVAEPFVTLSAERAACEQGEATQILCKVQQHHPFEGTATVRLLGLPPKVSADPRTLTKETAELVFDVQTDPSSPVGQHKTPFFELTITANGQ
ncbi:MAG: PPC domain-containing protein, partial [Pirellulales bacterium]